MTNRIILINFITLTFLKIINFYKLIIMNDKKTNYWNNNLKYVGILLSVWFMVSFGFSILLKDYLDSYSFAGFKLGFWFAQQGSILTFIVLIFFYAWRMNALDKKYGLGE